MANKEGLSLGYRMWWGIRRTVLTFLGPAQLGDSDPLYKLKQEREAKSREALAKKKAEENKQQPQRPY